MIMYYVQVKYKVMFCSVMYISAYRLVFVLDVITGLCGRDWLLTDTTLAV